MPTGISGAVAEDGFHTPFLVATLRNANTPDVSIREDDVFYPDMLKTDQNQKGAWTTEKAIVVCIYTWVSVLVSRNQGRLQGKGMINDKCVLIADACYSYPHTWALYGRKSSTYTFHYA
jgi:hypothetical protein